MFTDEHQRTTSNTLSIKNLPNDKLFRANLDYVLKNSYFYEKHEFFGISPSISCNISINTSDAGRSQDILGLFYIVLMVILNLDLLEMV